MSQPLTEKELDGLADGRGYHPDPMHNAKVAILVSEIRRLRSDLAAYHCPHCACESGDAK